MTVRDLHRWVLAVGLVLGLSLSFTQTTHAAPATFNVDTTVDNATLTACTPAPNDCSLRGAIIAANSNNNPLDTDTINVPAGTYTFAIPSTNEDAALDGDLDITQSVNILGAGAEVTIIQAAPDAPLSGGTVADDRVLHILTGTVQISNVTIRHGSVKFGNKGGGIYQELGELTVTNSIIGSNVGSEGGAIYSKGILLLIDDVVMDNISAYAGVVYSQDGMLTVTNSTFSDNTGEGDSGIVGNVQSTVHILNSTFMGNSGSIIDNDGTMTVSNSVISGNIGSSVFSSGTIAIDYSTISNNSESGILNWGGTLTVTNSTISGNSGLYGIINNAIWGDLTITNTTITGNSTTDIGGGIKNGLGTLTVNNSTISDNSASVGSGIIYNADVFTLTNTIITSATGANCFNNTTSNPSADIISNGYNLSSDESCAAFFDAGGDLNNVNPMLGPLRNNGGPTLTHALLPGSPAINGGDPDFVPPPDFDQRGIGFPRVQAGRIDIGAYEAWLLENPSGVVTDSLGNATYQWPDQPGAASYNLYVHRSASATDAVVNLQNLADATYCDGSVCTLDIVSAFGHAYWLSNGDYTAWLRANPGGAWTQAGTFTIATPLADPVTIHPPTETYTRRPTLHWTLEGEAVWASWFRLYIAPSNKLGTPVLDQWVMRGDVCGDMNGTVCEYALPLDLARNGIYQFWAQGWGPGGMSAWIGSGNFQIGPLVPEGLAADGLNLSWTASEGVTWYQVWIGTLGPVVAAHNQWYDATADLECGGGTCMLTPDVTLADGTYTWYVRGWGDGGYTLGGAGGWAQGPDIVVPIP